MTGIIQCGSHRLPSLVSSQFLLSIININWHTSYSCCVLLLIFCFANCVAYKFLSEWIIELSTTKKGVPWNGKLIFEYININIGSNYNLITSKSHVNTVYDLKWRHDITYWPINILPQCWGNLTVHLVIYANGLMCATFVINRSKSSNVLCFPIFLRKFNMREPFLLNTSESSLRETAGLIII